MPTGSRFSGQEVAEKSPLLNTKINTDTNVDRLTKEEIMEEARQSKNRARVKLLQRIHSELETPVSLETTYEYDPENDMSFSGEFEAIGV